MVFPFVAEYFTLFRAERNTAQSKNDTRMPLVRRRKFRKL
jgi:hypothetical protein